MKKLILAVLLTSTAYATDVQWSRFKGQVKAINYKASTLTIENSEHDLIGIKVDQDVIIREGKDDVALSKVAIDDKVTLLYAPKTPALIDQPDANGIIPSIPR